MQSNKIFFDHENLVVYQKSLEVVAFIDTIFDKIKNGSMKNQLERASSSIPMNIAEGNGKFTSKDRCKYFDIARGSALECASGLDVLYIRKLIDEDEVIKGKSQLREVVSMLVGLIKSNSDRVHEKGVDYNSE